MQRRLDRTFTLDPDELRRAVWVYLKSMDIPVPEDDDEITVQMAGNPVVSETAVTWTEFHHIETTK